jgi:hypothetical protein
MDHSIQGTGQPSAVTPKRPGSVPEVAKVTNQTGATVAQSTQRKPALEGQEVAQSPLQQIATLETMLPMEILKSPVLMRTEWAWRRLLVALAQVPPSQSENAVKTLWSTLASLVASESNAEWSTQLPPSFEPGRMVPFTDIQSHHLAGDESGKLKEWTQADRLMSATRAPDVPQIGGGIFVLPEPTSKQQRNAVRWEAQRRTRMTNHGQLVHQLSLELRVDNFPVKIQLLCAKPVLTISLETNHARLRANVQQRWESVQDALQGLGWRVERWTVGTLAQAEEEGL